SWLFQQTNDDPKKITHFDEDDLSSDAANFFTLPSIENFRLEDHSQHPQFLKESLYWILQRGGMHKVDEIALLSDPWDLKKVVLISAWHIQNGTMRQWLRKIFPRLPERPPMPSGLGVDVKIYPQKLYFAKNALSDSDFEKCLKEIRGLRRKPQQIGTNDFQLAMFSSVGCILAEMVEKFRLDRTDEASYYLHLVQPKNWNGDSENSFVLSSANEEDHVLLECFVIESDFGITEEKISDLFQNLSLRSLEPSFGGSFSKSNSFPIRGSYSAFQRTGPEEDFDYQATESVSVHDSLGFSLSSFEPGHVNSDEVITDSTTKMVEELFDFRNSNNENLDEFLPPVKPLMSLLLAEDNSVTENEVMISYELTKELNKEDDIGFTSNQSHQDKTMV
ncbi:hypothetical protein HK096_007243, partial [Nowakowskiella sp. JEL0078]